MLILSLLQFYYDYENKRNAASSSFNCSKILQIFNLHFLAYLQQFLCVLFLKKLLIYGAGVMNKTL